MLKIHIGIFGTKLTEADAILDSGLSGGLSIPKSIAKEAGARLRRVSWIPTAADGHPMPGRAAPLLVIIERAGIEIQTFAFCPDDGSDEVLLGSMFLGQVGAKIQIGKAIYKFPPEAIKNRRQSDLDFSDWVYPTNRPVTPWW